MPVTIKNLFRSSQSLAKRTFISLSTLLCGCASTYQQPENNSSQTTQYKQLACDFIKGQQWPYELQGSNIGICAIKLPPQEETIMVPDPYGGQFEVPEVRIKNNYVALKTPVGEGVGEFEGNYITGEVTTPTGNVNIICEGRQLTNAALGVCAFH